MNGFMTSSVKFADFAEQWEHEYAEVHLKQTTVSSVFEYAVRQEPALRNPCKNATLPTVKKSEQKVYTIEQAQLFIDTLIKKVPLLYRCYFILAIYSGFRRGELCGLTWQDVDFENQVISINKALYHLKGKGSILETTKTVTSNRSLKLPKELFDFLKKLQEHYEQERGRRQRQAKLWEVTLS